MPFTPLGPDRLRSSTLYLSLKVQTLWRLGTEPLRKLQRRWEVTSGHETWHTPGLIPLLWHAEET